MRQTPPTSTCYLTLEAFSQHFFFPARVTVSIVKNSHVSMVVNNNIRIMVLLHRVWKRHPVNVDFLGVYIHDDNQYSPLVHGLIGVSPFFSEELY